MGLFGLYSPLAMVSSYFPIVSPLSRTDQFKLAFGLFLCVTVFSLAALWIGEPILELLGLSTPSLIVTGGIALMLSGIPMMIGKKKILSEPDLPGSNSWQSVLLMPVTFPLTLNGTTFAFFVSYRAEVEGMKDLMAASGVGIAHAAVTAMTLYISGYLEKKTTFRGRIFLEKTAGILLTATAVSLIARGITRLGFDMLKMYSH